jgi:hypothetical protein
MRKGVQGESGREKRKRKRKGGERKRKEGEGHDSLVIFNESMTFKKFLELEKAEDTYAHTYIYKYTCIYTHMRYIYNEREKDGRGEKDLIDLSS